MAFQGIDFRDLWRPGSGLTLRRLDVLIRALPYDAPLWAALEREREKAQKPAAELIRERQAEWQRRNEARRAKEAG